MGFLRVFFAYVSFKRFKTGILIVFFILLFRLQSAGIFSNIVREFNSILVWFGRLWVVSYLGTSFFFMGGICFRIVLF